jgi:hypothetical protein
MTSTAFYKNEQHFLASFVKENHRGQRFAFKKVSRVEVFQTLTTAIVKDLTLQV